MSATPHGPTVRLVRVERTGSTNDDLAAAVEAAPHEWPHLSALVAHHQVAGHGRAGRDWHTPAGLALTVSFLLRPTVAPAALPSVPAIAGLAVARAVGRFLPAGVRAATKWPNDVLLVPAPPGAADRPGPTADPRAPRAAGEIEGWGTDRKVAGILARVVPAAGPDPGPHSGPAGTAGHTAPAGRAGHTGHVGAATLGTPGADRRTPHLGVVLGVGVNVAQGAEHLPVPWATSLALAGATASVDDVLLAVADELAALMSAFEEARGDLARAADPAGGGPLHAALETVCATVGRPVRVDLAGGRSLTGTAVGLDARGRLLLRTDGAARPTPDAPEPAPGAPEPAAGGGTLTVEAGEVTHLRTFSRPPRTPDAAV